MYVNRELYPLPELVITDMRMGDETGLELVEWIWNQEPPGRDIPIIILSGSCSPLQFDAAQGVGANAVHRKPTRMEDLQELLNAIAQEFCKPPGS